MKRSISRLPENILLRQISELEREINALKEVQEIGRNNTQVKTTKSNSTFDLSLASSGSNRTLIITFTPNRQRNAFFDFIYDMYINGSLNRSSYLADPLKNVYNDTPNATSETTTRRKIFLPSGSTYDFKFYANSIDAGVFSWAVV